MDALREGDCHKAIAFLNRAISFAPQRLDLIVKRAQIRQYGLIDYARALSDYRRILSELDQHPEPELEAACRQGIRDMVNDEPAEVASSF